MELNLDFVSGMVGNLRSVALDMGAEIEGQSEQLAKINEKVLSVFILAVFETKILGFFQATSDESRVVLAKEKAKRLLKK